MAVNSQINISINTTNAIKSIADLDNEIGGVVRTVTDLEMTISSLSEELRATEIGTQRFKELQSALIEAQGHMKDFELSVESLDAEQRASEFGSFAAGLAEIATGALALTHAMGLGSDETDKFVETMVGGFAIANTLRGGLEGIISAQKLLKNSTLATTVATEGGTVAMKAFNMVAKANPIGILLTLLAGAVTAFALFSGGADDAEQSVEELAETQKKLREEKEATNKAIAEQSGEFVGLLVQLRATNAGSDERLGLIKQINNQYGTTLQNLSDEKSFMDQINVAIDEYIGLQRVKFLQQRNQEKINELLTKEVELNEQKIQDEERLQKLAQSGVIQDATQEQLLNISGEAFKTNYLNRETAIQSLREELFALGVSTLDLVEQESQLTEGGKKYVEQTKDKTEATKKETKAKRELVDVEQELLRIDKEQEEERQKELTQESAFQEKLNTQRLTALNKLLKAELDANIGNEEEQKRIKEEFDKLIIQSEIEKTKNLIAIRKAYGEDVEDLLLKLSQLELGLSTDVSEKTEETFEELLANIASIASAVIGQIQGLANAIGENIRQQEENARAEREMGYAQEEARLENMLNSSLLSREEYESKLTDLNTKREMEERAARRRSFEQQKKMNVANAIMAGAQAVLGGLATQPLVPLGIIMAGIAAATSAIQISTIKSQTFTAAQGGIVPGSGPGNIDSVPALLAPGEAVINSNSTSMFGGLLSEINQMGGGSALTPDIPMKSTTGGGKPVYQENQKEQRVYVLENDITRSQRRVTRIEDISRF